MKFLSNQSISLKFSVLGLVALLLISVLTVVAVSQYRTTAAVSSNMIEGLDRIDEVRSIIKYTQQHRGLGNVVLNGGEEAEPKWLAARSNADQAWQAMQGSLPEAWKASRKLQTELVQQWQTLKTEVAGLSATDSFARHTALVEELLLFVRSISDESELTLDPVLGSYYLMSNNNFDLPLLGELLGRFRGATSGLLAAGNTAPSDLVLSKVQYGNIKQVSKAMHTGFVKVQEAGIALPAETQDTLNKLNNSIEQLGMALTEIGFGFSNHTGSSFFEFATGPLTLATQLSNQTSDTLHQILKARYAEAMQMLWSLIAAAVLVIGAVAGAGVLIFSNMKKRVELVLNQAQRMAKGQLNQPLENLGRDEIGKIGLAMEKLRLSDSAFVGQLGQNIRNVSEVSKTLTESSISITKSGSAQSDSASAVAASVEEMSVAVSQISDNAREAQEFSQVTGNSAQTGRQGVANVVTAVNNMQRSSLNLASTIETLGESSKSIGDIVQVISDIAEQTNLLALNAAIEAARAGEQGRGFSVVADEVRKLAENTTDATQQISGIIQSIQMSSNKAVEEVNGWKGIISDCISETEKSDHLMEEIEVASGRTLNAISDISRSIAEQSSASLLVAQKIEEMAAMAERNRVTVSVLEDTVRDLNNFSANVESQVKKYSI